MKLLNNSNILKIYEHSYSTSINFSEYYEAPRYFYNITKHIFYLNKENDSIILKISEISEEEPTPSKDDDFGRYHEVNKCYQFDETVTLESIVNLCAYQDKDNNKPFIGLKKLIEKHASIIEEDKHKLDAFERAYRRGYKRGYKLGEIESRQDAIMIALVLTPKGSISDELEAKIKSEANIETLKRWCKIADKANSVDDFVRAIEE